MYLKLYVEDFKKLHQWVSICEILNVDKTSTVLEINVANVKGNQEEEEEKELCEGCGEEVLLSDMSEVSTMYICNNCEGN